MSFLARIWLKNEFLGEKKEKLSIGGKATQVSIFSTCFSLLFFFIALYTLVSFFFVLVLALSQKRIIKEIEGLSENGESK